jgi:hypothetical protein
MKCTKCGTDVRAGYNYTSGFMCAKCADLRDKRIKKADELHKKLKAKIEQRYQLLEQYFLKHTELQLAYDGQHPKFKEDLKKEEGFPTIWNQYVEFCNTRKQELRELAQKINELKGGAK